MSTRSQKIIFEDIGLKKIDLALEKLLTSGVTIDDAFGKKKEVPIYFRTRDSKMIPDDTDSRGAIYVSYVNAVRADAAYRIQGDFCQVIAEDKDGNPVKFRVKALPEPHYFNYTITARSSELNDMRELQQTLDKFFPVFHRHLDVEGFKTKLFRDSQSNFDDEDLGIFISEWGIRILGYLYPDEAKARMEYAVRTALISIGPTLDPNAPDENFIVIDP